VLVRLLLIVLSITPQYIFADETSSSNPVEDLIRLKQKLILEHMSGDGETKLQRSIQDNLDQRNKEKSTNRLQGMRVDGSLTPEKIQEFEQQYKTPEDCESWKNNAHMVKCINHKMRSRDKFFDNKAS